MKSHVGMDILDKFVENTLECQDESKATLKQDIKGGAFMWMSHLLIHNSNQAKYGSLLNGLVSQFLMHAEQPVPKDMYDCNRYSEQSQI
jgi:hypothetical protein